MAHNSPVEVIEAYRRRQKRKVPFTLGDISKVSLFLIIVISSIYISLAGAPELPTIIELKTNTPTFTPSITSTPSVTASVTLTPTESANPDLQCACSSPVVLIVTATIGATHTPVPLVTESATEVTLPTSTFAPSETPSPMETLPPTATPVLYTVQPGDTLGGVALRFGVGVEAIQALNNLSSTMIYVGQVLQIPPP